MSSEALIGRLPPTCPEDATHGPMQQVPGTWSLDQVREAHGKQAWSPTGSIYILALYRCKSCGAIAMRDWE